MVSLKKVLMIATILFSAIPAFAVRLDGDAEVTVTPQKTNEHLQARLFEIFPMQKMNGDRVAMAIDRARNHAKHSLSGAELVATALELQFEELIQTFTEAQQESLRAQWQSTSWMIYSERAEHSLNTRPLGESRYYGRGQAQWFIDKKLESLPLLTKLLKMIVLTHVVGPQMMIQESEGFAFSQQTYATQKMLSQSSGFWTFSLWLEFVQVLGVLEKEVRLSSLEIKQIRGLSENLRSLHAVDSVDNLNHFLRTHFPVEFREPKLKEFLQKWLNESFTFSDVKAITGNKTTVKSAKILAFKPRVADKTQCQIAIEDPAANLPSK